MPSKKQQAEVTISHLIVWLQEARDDLETLTTGNETDVCSWIDNATSHLLTVYHELDKIEQED